MAFASELLPGFVFFAERGHGHLGANVPPADEKAGAIGGQPGPADDGGLDGSGEGVVSHFSK